MDVLGATLSLDISPITRAIAELNARVIAQDKKIEEQRKQLEASKELQTSTRKLIQQSQGPLLIYIVYININIYRYI